MCIPWIISELKVYFVKTSKFFLKVINTWFIINPLALCFNISILEWLAQENLL